MNKIHNRFKFAAFARKTHGTVAVLFAILSVAVLGAAGIAVDFVKASAARSSLQGALDSAVLAAAAARVETDQEAETIIAKYMAANWAAKHPELDAQVSQVVEDEEVTGAASVTMPTLISGVLGINTVEVSVTSTATMADNIIEVAMVIDNSSSMSSSLSLLKEAVEGVVDTLVPNGTNPDIRFAVIPYAAYVNVGLDNKDQSWLDLSAEDEASWDGCVGSRNYPLELDDSDSTPIPAVVDALCNPTPLLPLTSDVDAVKSWIDGLEARVSDTYTGAGLIWGWRALSEAEPLTEAEPYGSAQKVLIFLSDAASTVGPSYPRHNNEDDIADNVWMAQCTNVKNQGIALYTIAFDTSSHRRQLLADCATSSAHAYTADDATDLKDAFEAIADQIRTPYLSH
ncbi:MAG TPA: VWA domain-containing protein [Aestuariivirgaceae bacterium]|jgi:Flp pilus assembly protein TadG